MSSQKEKKKKKKRKIEKTKKKEKSKKEKLFFLGMGRSWMAFVVDVDFWVLLLQFDGSWNEETRTHHVFRIKLKTLFSPNKLSLTPCECDHPDSFPLTPELTV